MSTTRILIVEDDPAYQRRYKEWIPDKYNVDSVDSSIEAIDLLKKKHYALVILDLSLNPENNADRSSKEVQEYLNDVKQSEGTLHVIVSNHVDYKDTRLSFRDYSVQDVITKNEVSENPQYFIELIGENIKKHYVKLVELNFSEIDYKQLAVSENQAVWDYSMLQVLNPRNRVMGFQKFFKAFSDNFSPIANHLTRKSWHIWPEKKCLVAIMWSRAQGIPITIHLSNQSEANSIVDAREAIEEWLGWTPGALISEIVVNDIPITKQR